MHAEKPAAEATDAEKAADIARPRKTGAQQWPAPTPPDPRADRLDALKRVLGLHLEDYWDSRDIVVFSEYIRSGQALDYPDGVREEAAARAEEK